jgi:hypothetical protein
MIAAILGQTLDPDHDPGLHARRGVLLCARDREQYKTPVCFVGWFCFYP